MKPISLFLVLFILMPFGLVTSQATDLSAAKIFAKVVDHYDPNGVWADFDGSIHMYTIGPNWMSQEDLTLNNAEDYYRTIRYMPEGTYARGTSQNKVFFLVDGKNIAADRVPEKLQGDPYGLNESSTRAMREHHIFHFSVPLALQAAGASPLPEVTTETLFGADCLVLRFTELPGSDAAGFYHKSPLTLYIDPANGYRLHAMHMDNGMWVDEKGVLVLFSGELEVDGLKIPARKLYFAAADRSFQLLDVFTNETRFD